MTDASLIAEEEREALDAILMATGSSLRYYEKHTILKIVEAFRSSRRQLEEENNRLSALLHEACKMLATLGDQMNETAEDKFEIEEFQARARNGVQFGKEAA